MENSSGKLSVVIIVKNEERNIRRCLESIKNVADDIVIADSYSTDNTENICKEYHVNFIQHEWDGYSKTKNFANDKAKYDWILSLDADEALSTDLQDSILRAKQNQETDFYKVRRFIYYCGKWIKHTDWNPDIKIRLFNRQKARWVGDYVHEKLVLNGEIDKIPLLEGHCYHYSINSIEEHISQVNKFSTLAALEQFEKGRKASYTKLFLSPLIKFIKSYFVKGGFRDGFNGFAIAVISSYAKFLRELKLFELRRAKQ